MVELIIAHVDEMITAQSNPTGMSASGLNISLQFKTLNKLLSDLSANSIPAGLKTEFTAINFEAEQFAIRNTFVRNDYERDFLKKVRLLLNKMSTTVTANVAGRFGFVHDPGLRQIIARDYTEVASTLYQAMAWKSVVVMAGSILEAVLLDQLTKDAAIEARVIAFFSRNPDAKKGKKQISDFKSKDSGLADLIDAAVGINLIRNDVGVSIHGSVRQFRNYIHPSREIRTKSACTDAEAMIALGSLKRVCKAIDPGFDG